MARREGARASGGVGARGRKPESPVNRVLRGAATFKEIVKSMVIQVPAITTFPPPPDILAGEAKNEWIRITTILQEHQVELLNPLELSMLEVYCTAWEIYRLRAKQWRNRKNDKTANMLKNATDNLYRYMDAMGLTPYARLNMLNLDTLKQHQRASNPTGDTNHGRREFEKKTEAEKAELAKFVKSSNQVARNYNGTGRRGNRAPLSAPTFGEAQNKGGKNDKRAWNDF